MDDDGLGPGCQQQWPPVPGPVPAAGKRERVVVLVLMQPIWVVLHGGAIWVLLGSQTPTSLHSTPEACCHALGTWWTAPVKFSPLARTANIDVDLPTQST